MVAQNLQSLFVQALRLHQAGRLDEAGEIYQQILAVEPGHGDARHLLGVIATQQSRHGDAVDLISAAIRNNDRMPPYHANLGTSLLALGRRTEAALSYTRALALDPAYADAHNHLATTFRDLADLPMADRHYRLALRVRPDYTDALNNLGNLLRESGHLTESEECYRRALAMMTDTHPKLGVTLANLATLLRDMKRYAEAEAAYRAALQLRPLDAELHGNRSVVLKELDALDESHQAAETAIVIDPGQSDHYGRLANLRKLMGRVTSALKVCGFCLTIDPDSAEGHSILGTLQHDLGRDDLAEAAILRSIALQPDQLSYYLSYSAAHRYRRDDAILARLEQILPKAASLSDEEQTHLHFALAKAYEDLGERDASFEQQLLGNRAKRRQIDYVEADMIDFFERIRRVYSRDFIRSHVSGWQNARGPIFILGMMRSGSTLVEQVLASHPLVHGAGEVSLFRQALNKLSGSLRFPEIGGLLSHQDVGDLGAGYERRLWQEAPGAVRITDKNLYNFLYCGLIAAALPHARILHTMRDPTDTCLSIFSKLFVGHQPFGYDLGELGRYYRLYRGLMDHWCNVLPEGVLLDVRYEDMVGDLEGQVRRILDHCELPWDDACLSFHQTQRPVQTASASQVRQPIYRSSIGRWRPAADLIKPLIDELSLLP